MQQTLKKNRKDEIINYIKENKCIAINDFKNLDTINGSKMLERALKYLELEEDLLIKEKKSRTNIWKLKEDIVLERISKKDAINLDYALELSAKEFTLDVQKTIMKIFSSNDNSITGHLAIFEELKNEKMVKNFDKLKKAIENKEYINLEVKYSLHPKFYDVKPIRLVFLDNNWYIAFEYYDNKKKQKIFRLGRVAFVKSIEYLKDNKYSDKNRFQTKDIQKYLDWLDKEIQNSMTFYGKEPKIATLKATGDIAQYFKDGMKKFLSSQKIIKEDENEVIFSVTYTNELEIMPFVQRWLPDLVILEPQELKYHYKEKLQQILQNLA